MADLARPMLAEGLAALTSTPVGLWLPWMKPFPPTSGAGVRWELTGERVAMHITLDGKDVSDGPTAPWTITDPAEAQETLVARGLLPEGWCDVARRGWHERQARDDGWGDWCDVVLAAPRTIHDLVAVTSLGWDAVCRAEEYALEAPARLREYGCPQPKRVVWRMGERGKHWHKVRGCGNAMVTLEGVVYNERSKPKCAPVAALWSMGLALDTITADAVRIVVPPVGAST